MRYLQKPELSSNETKSATSLDLQIDRTLQAIGKVEPPSSLNRRVLCTLAAPPPERVRSMRMLAPFTSGFSLRPGTFAAAVLGIALAAAGLLHLGSRRHNVQQAFSPGLQTDHPAERNAPRAFGKAGFVSPGTGKTAWSVTPPERAHIYLSVSSLSGSAPAPMSDALPSTRALEAIALADLHSPSFPAPPPPPTEQERVVALMLRRGEKHDLAELNPERSLISDLQERAAFHDFFDPPPDPRILHQTEAEPIPQPATANQPKAEGQPQ